MICLTLTACSDNDDPVSTTPPDDDQLNIVEIAQDSDDFNILVSALGDADLVSALSAEGPFNVFAPTDTAFESLPDGLLESLTPDQLTEILSYHVISGEIMSGDLSEEQSASALSGGDLYITAGDQVVVNGKATVTTADIEASNGVIHVIDDILLPDAFLDVVGVVMKRYTLQTLVGAVVDADLAETLMAENEAGYTVFAPSNEAFAALPDGTLESLTQEDLQGILTYHVLAAEVLSGEISPGTVETVNGAELDIDISNGTVTLTDQTGNTVTVTTADLQGTNGVVHVIDGVLLPGS